MGQVTFQQIFKAFAVFFLGYTVYSTERAIRNKQARHQFRRSATTNQSPFASKIQEASKSSHPDYQKVYILKIEPAEVVFPQDAEERQQYEETFSKSNYTKYQFPDYVNVPLSELGVVYYNGIPFYRQGVQTAPQYDISLAGPNTRSSIKDEKCPGKPKAAKKEPAEEPEESVMQFDVGVNWEPEEPEEKPEKEEKEEVHQIGCCNGMPYNTNKRCCCRRASFNKDEKFCCAINGCGDFKIMKKSEANYDMCNSLSGVVVQEYGYHKMAGARDMGFMKNN
ncbi:Oidioi.mRNA.OKI2018_I69.chr2.g4614.t1.cds [Oikopleura dioica]|uniref:Oidioi.mRNA.OKI2018_I69.chr2.g4614.t1.cds n=1 Tax=Oikopleura dioica TaxID=34765 RepID=A0ABN7T1A2_OIKDI|nr:Oidioi.mRNA.OKI2018_I69.chr2.g4614.t1.cds [Oikopleura dioica]